MKFVICAGALMLAMGALMARNADDEGWISMFDGKTLNGWKANGHPESWSAKNGEIVGDGEASHLFWMVKECVNCEFKADVKINHGGNSGMYIRAAFGPGFPHGYEAQVDNTHRDPVRTGSLYNFAPFYKQLIPDDTWWNQRVMARGNHIVIHVNATKTADYTDEKNTYTHGYLALQQHNKGGIVEYKNLYMKPLP